MFEVLSNKERNNERAKCSKLFGLETNLGNNSGKT